MTALLRCLSALAALAFVTLPARADVMTLMPKEIREAEQPSIDGAARLLAARPDALRQYTVDGRSIRYVELAQPETARPLVIFVHGSPGLWRTWVPYLNDPDLQAKADLIAMDRPGFGDSGSGDAVLGFAAQARMLAPLLDRAQPGQRVVLVGHALAGALIARMAMAYPDRITDLVMTAAPLDPNLQQESWFQYLADLAPVTWLLPREIVVFNREYLRLAEELREMQPLWPKVGQRVSLLLGTDDAEVPLATGRFARQMLSSAPAVNVIELPATNHFIPWTRFGPLKAAILGHLDAP